MDEMVKSERGNYLIENEFNISGIRYFLAYDSKSKNPFMVGEKQRSDVIVKYDNLIVTDDYITALEEWNRRIANAIENLKAERVELSDMSLLGRDDIEPIGENSIKGKVVVIKADCFLHESQYAQKQLYVVNGGFGAEARSKGRAVFCESIFNGEHIRFNRQDILGVLKEGHVPAWASDRIKEIQDCSPHPVLADSATLTLKVRR